MSQNAESMAVLSFAIDVPSLCVSVCGSLALVVCKNTAGFELRGFVLGFNLSAADPLEGKR